MADIVDEKVKSGSDQMNAIATPNNGSINLQNKKDIKAFVKMKTANRLQKTVESILMVMVLTTLLVSVWWLIQK